MWVGTSGCFCSPVGCLSYPDTQSSYSPAPGSAACFLRLQALTHLSVLPVSLQSPAAVGRPSPLKPTRFLLYLHGPSQDLLLFWCPLGPAATGWGSQVFRGCFSFRSTLCISILHTAGCPCSDSGKHFCEAASPFSVPSSPPSCPSGQQISAHPTTSFTYFLRASLGLGGCAMAGPGWQDGSSSLRAHSLPSTLPALTHLFLHPFQSSHFTSKETEAQIRKLTCSRVTELGKSKAGILSQTVSSPALRGVPRKDA